MATPRLRSYFFKITNLLRPDGTRGGIRFRTNDIPTQQTYEDLFESATFKKETGDRAKIWNNNATQDLDNEQGLTVLATDIQAKSNQSQLSDRSLVAQPHQLPTVVPNTTEEIDGDDMPTTQVSVEVDNTILTRNNFKVGLADTFLNWIKTKTMRGGGTIGQVPVKNNGTDNDWSWSNEYRTTSLTSITIPSVEDLPTSRTVTVAASGYSLCYIPGSRVRVYSSSNSNNYIEGLVQTYISQDLEILVDKVGGSGTFNSWKVNLGGSFEANNTLLLSGGNVTVDNSDKLKLNITSAKYIIGGEYHEYTAGSVTLSPGHAQYNRIDAIVLNTDETVSVITGTPSESPTTPTIPKDKLLLSFVSVLSQASSSSDTITVINELKELLLGGHRQGDSIIDRNAQPNKKPGMFYFLNSKFNVATSLTMDGPATIAQVGDDIFVFNNVRNALSTGVDINIVTGNSITSTVTVTGSYNDLRYVFQDDDKVYFIARNPLGDSYLMYIDKVSHSISGSALLVGDSASSGIYYKNKIYVASIFSNVVYVIDRIGFTLITTHTLPSAWSFAVDEDRDKIYACSLNGTTMKVINYNTNALITTLTVPTSTVSLSARTGHENSWIYYNNSILFTSRVAGQVQVLDTSTDTFGPAIIVGSNPVEMIKLLCNIYVVNNGSDSVSVIDIHTKTVTKTVTVNPSPCFAGNALIVKDSLFIPFFGDLSLGGGVVEIETNTKEVFSVTYSGVRTRGIAFIESTNKLYSTSQSSNTLGIYNYQPWKLFVLSRNNTSWIDLSPLSQMGGVADGLLRYSGDFSECITDDCIPDISIVKSTILKHYKEVSIDITGSTTLDLADYDGYTIIRLTSSNATETINSITNTPDHAFKLCPASGLTLTITGTAAVSATANQIVLENASEVLNGTKGNWIELRNGLFGNGSRVTNIAKYI